MGLSDVFVWTFCQKSAVGKNRPYFLRSVELVKTLKGLSDLKANAQKELPELYNQLQKVLEMSASASGRDARKGEDEELNKMFDEAIRDVHAFLRMHDSANRAQLFADNMKEAWEGDSGSVKKMAIMEGRIYDMMKKYEKMKKMTYTLRHWLQPKPPSIETSDWVEYAVTSRYNVEDGITIEEFSNRLLTNMVTEKIPGFRSDFLLLNPRLYYYPIFDDDDFFNFKLRGETLAPGKLNKILKDINSTKFDLAFDFANNKTASLQDLIHRTFNTDVEEVLGWIGQGKNVYWSRCPTIPDTFKRTGNKEKDCSYKDKLHEGHAIFRDEEGNMKHMLILEDYIRKEPDKEKFDPKKVLLEHPPKEEKPPTEKPSQPSQPAHVPKPSSVNPAPAGIPPRQDHRQVQVKPQQQPSPVPIQNMPAPNLLPHAPRSQPPSLSIPGSSDTQNIPTTLTPSTPIQRNDLNISKTNVRPGSGIMARQKPPPTPKKQGFFGSFLGRFSSSSKIKDED